MNIMSFFIEELEHIKTLLLSTQKSEKSFGYSTLLHLQEQSNTDDSFIQTLRNSTQTLLSSMIVDIQDDDEEVAVQALKCLGFMIYHPSLVARISTDAAGIVVDSLARLITTTKNKSVCNLGVWCISMQQLESSFLANHFNSVLRAIVHSLDNPIGSLSVTFEAIQAVMKLSAQLSMKMKDTSSIWAPPIYRRLLSGDKRERDMGHRCLLKIKSTICPPPLTLSKVVVQDLKSKLLPGIKELMKNGKKIQALQAWGWFVRLLGSHALKTRHLVNDMLKVPEQTFSDQDPQVQIASQVAWEGLIDALIYLPLEVPNKITTQKSKMQPDVVVSLHMSKADGSEVQTPGHLKSVKLIMTPLIGVVSSKCDIAVRSSCLNTWCYLLHKLDASVNDPYIPSTVLEPIFKAVFQNGPEDGNILFWNFCIDLLYDFVQAKSKNPKYELNNLAGCSLSSRTANCEFQICGERSWKHYPVKWLPWDCSQLDFLIRMIDIMISQVTVANISVENRNLAGDFAVRIFRSVLKGVRIDFKECLASYDAIMQSLDRILMFVKKICEDVISEDDFSDSSLATCLQFVEAVTNELEHSMLQSPLYRVALDLRYAGSLQPTGDHRPKKPLDISSIGSMDMVSPTVYLTMLYISTVVHSIPKAASIEIILHKLSGYLRILLSSYDAVEVLHTIVVSLCDLCNGSCLRVWIRVAQGLQDYLENTKYLLPLKVQFGTDNLVVFHFLIIPLLICSTEKVLTTEKDCKSSVESSVFSLKLTFEHVTEVWKSLYCCINSVKQIVLCATNRVAEVLSSLLNGFLDESTSMIECRTAFNSSDKLQELHLLCLCGEAAKCILENLRVETVTSKRSESDSGRSSGINNSLEFTARILKLSWRKKEGEPFATMSVISRLLPTLVSFVCRLQLKEDIFSFFKVICVPLVPWLSDVQMTWGTIDHHLQPFWTETLKCLQRSWPPVIFDSSFLELQAPLLAKTLDHPSPSISEPSITFWNSTYSDQTNLDFPPCLLRVLDKLSREGKININKRRSPLSEKDDLRLEVAKNPWRFKVTAKLNMSWKRVELMEDKMNENNLPPFSKRRLELTEHQKEVRRAQQGREGDCGGHGPGIRTYTSVDFSQGNEDSQESEDIRNPELILDLLRRVG
ncbi:hypothetical protein Ancab_035158 [Ancistrocladus abbreviatus]